MAKEICISTTPHETRLAILEDDQLAEIYYERENEYTLAGSIYKGRVTRVLPGMQSSFVDVGLERDAFLYVTDFLEEQEDSEEYGGEASGRRQSPTYNPEEAQTGEERPERQDRPDRPDRQARPDRGERNGRPDRGDRDGGRRPLPVAAAASQQAAEPSREGGRAGRERAREQAIAPLREAVPAAQDLQEKGDEELPGGTRRWRGRRGRRRGVRGGLADPRPLPNSTPEALEEAGVAEYEAAAPFAIAEHGAPGGIADLHASPEVSEQHEPASTRGAGSLSQAEPQREPTREAARDRSGRRQREPYAQASTFDRRPAAPGVEPGREPEIRASALPAPGSSAAPAPGSSAASQPVIVLPGESLSKYGSAPADPAQIPAPTASVPRPAARPVNYIAPKPSTLVELSGSWDGGAVLPGETLSRYRGSSAVELSASTAQSSAHSSVRPNPEPLPIPDSLAPEVPADAGLDQVDAVDAPAQPAPAIEGESVPEPHVSSGAAAGSVGGWASGSTSEAVQAPAALHEEPQVEHPTPLVEPEIMAEALPSTQESAAKAPEAVIVHPGSAGAPVANLPESDAAPKTAKGITSSAEPAEYEPHNASASYRVDPAAPRELRIAGPEEDQEQLQQPEQGSGAALPQTQEVPAETLAETPERLLPDHASSEPVALTEPAPALAESAGHFADAPVTIPTDQEASSSSEAGQAPGPVADLAGELGQPAESVARPHEQPLSSALAHAGEHSTSTLRILHGDGSVETLDGPLLHGATVVAEASLGVSPAVKKSEQPIAGSFEANGFDLAGAAATKPAGSSEGVIAAETQPASPSDFAQLVDRLQGFAPGHGLLEEETIDEEEYDFEPMHAHSDEHDQEDLEEETLDHQMDAASLSDAVRDSYLEQRVHQLPEEQGVAFTSDEEAQEAELHEGHRDSRPEAEASFGFIEISEDEDEGDEEEVEEGGEPSGDSERVARSGDDRGGRGRTGRSGGRNGGGAGGRRGGPGRGGRSAQSQDLPIISDMLKQGQEILVQIAKEPIAKKGARITSHIALPGRFLVFMPTVSHVGVSRKIASDEERQRLKRILISEKGDSTGGFIVRTAAEGAGEEDLRADLRFLISLWTEIKQRSDSAKAPALIYHDLNLIERILRDQVSSNFSTIWVDSEAEYERIIRFLNRFQPALVRRVKLYTKETPLFEHFGIQEEISKALKSKVWLKSGGSIVINQTEALVAIDINTGKYVGKTARLEDTIVKTNLDAIPEIVRQIRLRDLGGIIVIDFIDMDERKNRNRVLAALEEELKHDRAPSKVLQFNDFGLVAITRKRVKQSLERTLSVTCEVCTGTGMVKSPMTVCNEIYIEMRKMQKHLDGKDVLLRVHPEVVKQLKAGNGKWINELEEMVSKTIIIKSDPALHPEQFDIH